MTIIGSPRCFTYPIKAKIRRTRRELFPVFSRIQKIAYALGERNLTPE